MNDNFYRAFEERYRGSRDLIKSRLRVYLPFVEPLAGKYSEPKAVDLGCGRGEWLELMQESGLDAWGVDLDEGMLAACRERELKVRTGDAVSFLKNLPGASQVVVTGFHIAEHIPFSDLQVLVEEALRVLKPGGLLIMETPNPENIVVGASTFYRDPTHQRPIPPQLLSFLLEYNGFKRVKILRLQESPVLSGGKLLALLDVLGGVSPDYAVVAQKTGETEILAATNSAFEAEHGFTLECLANRYDQQAEARVNKLQNDLEAFQAANHRYRKLFEVREQQIHAIYQSHSWRITAPMRWCGYQAQLLRQHGLVLRFKAFVKKIIRSLLSGCAVFLTCHPGFRLRCVALTKRFGIYSSLHSFYFLCVGHQYPRNALNGAGQDLTIDQLSPRARQIYADLKAAIESRQSENR